MKTYIVLFFLLSANIIFAQKIDSVKYDNGYLYFHKFGNKGSKPKLLLSGRSGNNFN